MTSPVDRRTFLRAAAAAPLAGVVGSPAAAVGQRVVVLGAGLAGLAAACNLLRLGYDVTVLEAQNRPGGRVQTLRTGFQCGGHAELGAIRIFETHDHTLRWVKEMGLDLVPYDTGTRAYVLQGKRFLAPPAGSPWPLEGFTDQERPDPGSRLGQILMAGFTELGDVLDSGWPANDPSALELDRETIESFARSQGASSTLLELFYAQEGRAGRVNAAAAFAAQRLAAGTTAASIEGGNDRLPYAMAARLGQRVKYNCQVVRIAQDPSSVTIGYVDPTGRQQQLRADRCVCALPFAPLRRVATAFSATKADVISKLEYFPVARCYFQTRTRFWRNDPLGPLGGLNLVNSDVMAGRVWNTSSQQADPALGMVLAYMFDNQAVEYAAHAERRITDVRNQVEQLLPGIQEQIVALADKVWQEDQWAGGGWGVTPRGQLHWMLPASRQVEGRVHFAGEHTSLWAAWMNGALESAERVTAEITSMP